MEPRKIKFRKPHLERRLRGKIATKGDTLVYGEMGIKSLESKLIRAKQLEACIAELKRKLGKKGRYWLRVFPHFPRTKKPAETRMGGGKGDIDEYVGFVKPGTIIFEVGGLEKAILKEALKGISYKLPVKTKIIEK